MYTIGYKTRLFKILSWLVIISIHGRNPLLTNGGDVVMTIWWLWTIWLPQGQRFSIDALLVSLRGGGSATRSSRQATATQPDQFGHLHS